MTTDHLPVTPAPAVRVSDTEREAVATRLRDAATDGRLTLTEADERQAQAYAAQFRHELVPLTADLPVPAAAEPTGPARGALTDAARRRLAVHAAIVAVLAAFLVTRWAVDGPADGPGPDFFWPAWPLFWLGLSVLVHYRRATRRWA